MIHKTTGEKAFLNAWDFTTESETGEALADFVLESTELALEMYKTHIYAVVSDNAANMIKFEMGRLSFQWQTTFNSHIGNLLSKDILSDIVLKEI